MSQEELVTVFIPMYNAKQYIKQSLDSIINQSYKNLDILIIDDGSTDGSKEVVKQYNDKRIRLICNEKNMGIPYTRNIGIKEAKGSFIALMDADDISNKNRIKKQVDFLKKNKDIDVVSSNVQYFSSQKIKNFINMIKVFNKKCYDHNQVSINLLFKNPIANPAAMIRSNSLIDFNLSYDKNCFVAQDYKLWSDISKVGKIYIMKETLLKYRYGHINITKKSTTEKFEQRKQILNSIKDSLLDFYEFNLSKEDKLLFNCFFGEEDVVNLSYEDLLRMNAILNSIVNVNKNKKIFDSKLLEDVMNENMFNSILSSTLNLKDKIEFYKKLKVNTSTLVDIKRINYLILRNYI